MAGDAPILICPCGKRLKAAGATPGRLGRCPACGGQLRVPDAAPPPVDADDIPEPAGGYMLAPVSAPRPSTFNPIPPPPRPSRSAAPPPREGFIHPPGRAETTLRESLLYPFWGSYGIILLLFMPPAFWLVSAPGIVLIDVFATGTAFSMMALILLIPAGLGFLAASTYTLLFLGRLLVSSALGEVPHPHAPAWDFDDILGGLYRWFAALVGGFAMGILPIMVYWLYCGDIDLFDRIILAELGAVGASYALMALLAALLHDDPWAANPITVIRAILRVGWPFARPSLVAGFALMLTLGGFAFVLQTKDAAVAAIGLLLCWVVAIYAAMVTLRILGLFHHRHRATLGWVRDRPRWGA